MKYAMYRTMSKDRKNHVILGHDDIEDTYYVSCKLYGKYYRWEYATYNHACFKFDVIHKEFLRLFSDTVLTNLKY